MSSRFANSTEKDIESLQESRIPENTIKSSAFSKRLFDSWAKEQGNTTVLNLETSSFEELAAAFPKFFADVRTIKGEHYRSSSIRSICNGINRILTGRDSKMSFFDHNLFKSSYAVADGLIKTLKVQEDPKGARSDTITKGQESVLFKLGILGNSNPETLQRTLLYFCGKYFAIRGGEELRNVRVDDFRFRSIAENLMEITYLERRAKNRQGGLGSRKVSRQVITS